MSDTASNPGFAIRETKELASLFPGYDIKHLVATGGMGAVYCAVQQSLDRVVAIKILPTEFSRDPEFCAAFEAEAKAMAKLNHPNLIGVFDFGEVAGMLYIIMEYVEGETLFNVTKGGVIKTSESLRLMQGICAGVANAHQHGILHRDIKPANILLDAHLQPKIGDFGLARPLDREVEDGETIFGTPGYTAPEVIEPPHRFDQRADIFSLGVMLHELITGKLPEDDPRPASLQVRCHPRVDAVIRKATQPDPEKRFQTAAEMASELAKVSQPGQTMATKLSVAAGSQTRGVSTVAGSEIQQMSQGDMLRAKPKPERTAGGGALRLGAGGGGALAVPRPAGSGLAAPAAGAARGAGALGGQPPAMMMSSGTGSHMGIWIAVIILVFAGIVILMLGGGDGGNTEPEQNQTDGLSSFIDSQKGSVRDLLDDSPVPPEPPPTSSPAREAETKPEP